MANVRELRVNGKTLPIDAEPDRPLLGVLRDDLGLTGTKYGCGKGSCGACTVLIDGVATRSCITPIASVDSKAVVTIEGIANNGQLHPLQQAFLDLGAMQCGYCTCGMIVAGVGLLKQNPRPTRNQIVEAMDGNVCRCGTYPRIIAAITKAGQMLAEAGR